jgi:hypothetical protein
VTPAVLAPVLAVAGFGLYMLATLRLAVWRRYPIEFVALSALGAIIGIVGFARDPGLATGLGAGLALAIVAFMCWFLFSFSMYGPREDHPRPGDRFPDFTLPTSDGRSFSLAEARGRRLILLFYRGAW